jgi:hypothetical protein
LWNCVTQFFTNRQIHARSVADRLTCQQTKRAGRGVLCTPIGDFTEGGPQE